MAIFQPSNIIPSALSGIGQGTVAVEDNVSISWQVNGNSPMTAFKITIMTNDVSSSIVYEDAIISVGYGLPFYPTDNKGNAQFFTYAPGETTWASWGLEDGNNYKLQITQFWGNGAFSSTSYADKVIQYSESPFITRAVPTLSIDMLPDILTSTKYTFGASYDQADGDSIDWVRWELASIDTYGNVTILDDTGEVNTLILSYDVDGLLEGVNYQVRASVQTQNGIQVSTNWVPFNVLYSSSALNGGVDASIQQDGSILLDVSNIALKTSTNLFDEATIFAGIEGMERSNGYYVFSALKARTAYGTTSGIASLTPVFKENTQYTFSCSVYVENATASSAAFRYIIYYTDGTNQPFNMSSSELETVSFTTAAGKTVSYVRMYATNDGTVYMKNCWLNEGTEALPYEPYVSSSQTISGYNIYRKTGYSLALDLIASIPTTTTQFKDFSAVSGTNYTYEVFAVLSPGDTLSAPLESQPVGIRYNAYQLIEATADAENPNLYHALNTWLFGNNIEAGSVSNNNVPTFLANFTKYPLKQVNTQIYRSGILSALLSNVVSASYQDTASQMDKLYNVSASTNPFFLKDMKGNIYMVTPSDAITQTINTKTLVQEVTVSIPWQEIGDASTAVIVQLPSDEGWEGENEVFAVDLAVDITTGELIATYNNPDAPIEYTLTGKNNNVLTITGESQYIGVTTFTLTGGALIANN